ncbi:uncharacterized protein LOC105421194 [Amborella trichopoda]|uniref:uncharacterized protein LOC105421194 n=1 Tax=Amborella trichopoda TaxID=13333 RepID=UPI0005D434FA|nr:uncharacterized protein LOC105421194 [Amborella trichopoda]|eukprot:XP_011625925.1 uncharacterized protein LOC105421194 [Amborella trichopoda]
MVSRWVSNWVFLYWVKMIRTRSNNASCSNENIEALGEFFKTLGAMTQMMKYHLLAPATPAPNQADSSLTERFWRLAPPTFLGHGGVEKAERWRRQVEKIFDVLHYFDEQKVRERKEVELIELQQGKLLVDQYASKFAELSCYASHIINTEARKVNKFVRSLQPDIRGRIISANLKTSFPLVDLAMKIKRDCEEFRLRKEGKVGAVPSGNFRRTTRPPPRREFGGRNNQGNTEIQNTFPGDVRDNRRLTCSYCGLSSHSAAECYKKVKSCFRCGKPGHLIKDCPVKGPENRPRTQGQVFSLMKQEAKAFTSVIRGTLSVYGIEARVLIDPRSSHSFVAPHFAYHINVRPSLLD